MAKNNLEVTNKTNLWVVVGVALVIALVVSLITAGITGNVIKQNNNVFGKYQIYTKQEVDAKLTQVYTKQEVAAIITCIVNSPFEGQVSEGETVTIGGRQVSINFISATQVKLKVGNDITNVLSVGSTYKLSDGSYVGVKEIRYSDVAGTVGSVKFSLKPTCVI